MSGGYRVVATVGSVRRSSSYALLSDAHRDALRYATATGQEVLVYSLDAERPLIVIREEDRS